MTLYDIILIDAAYAKIGNVQVASSKEAEIINNYWMRQSKMLRIIQTEDCIHGMLWIIYIPVIAINVPQS